MINYKKIITKDEFDAMSQEKYEYAVKEGLYHADYLKGQYPPSTLRRLLVHRALEISTIGTKYYKESEAVQQLIACNIVFPDNEKIIKILLSKDLTYDKICAYARVVSGIKKIALQTVEFDTDNSITIADKKVNGLCSLIRLHTGVSDYNLIVSKISEIAAHHKDLYIQLQEENEKVR